MLYRQFVLQDSNTSTTCWLPEKKKGIVLEPGVRITLEDDKESRWWTVQSVGSITKTKAEVKNKEKLQRKYKSTTDI